MSEKQAVDLGSLLDSMVHTGHPPATEELTKTFNTSRHASVFEGVPLGRHPGESIHKMMSAPIVDGTKVIGVVQISRKGHSASNAGPDFTQKDLRALTSLSPTLMQFLKLFQVD